MALASRRCKYQRRVLANDVLKGAALSSTLLRNGLHVPKELKVLLPFERTKQRHASFQVYSPIPATEPFLVGRPTLTNPRHTHGAHHSRRYQLGRR
jgi:hypothetical protein